ncbi:hypothetical protein QBC45DRAFT_149326 [Copromyces sp. CBS 386.78]|nr:hypothetical protein QBC45DRAFT_149326 [Copromyces sp. CBS 386.78]
MDRSMNVRMRRRAQQGQTRFSFLLPSPSNAMEMHLALERHPQVLRANFPTISASLLRLRARSNIQRLKAQNVGFLPSADFCLSPTPKQSQVIFEKPAG